MAETPKKSVGRPLKKPSCSDFCRVCDCNFNTYYGDFKRRVSTENLFEIPNERALKKVAWLTCCANLELDVSNQVLFLPASVQNAAPK